jgi:type IV pilus assembly protein PilO
MNLMEELRSLDPRDPGRWPLAIRAGAVGIAFVVLALLGVYVFVWNQQRPELERRQDEEQQLRAEFRNKHSKAVNLEVYKQQLKDIERSFGALLRQLPGKTEVPSLLVDISQTGLAAGLQEKLFQPEPEVKKDFYAELPIKIRLTGSYHQFGEFVSGIAALPRIVTLDDINIKPDSKDAYDQLSMELTAKTYRYLDEDEIAAAAAEADKGKNKTVVHRPEKPAG